MSSEPKKHRLLTRSDFDGLVCAILLKELGMLGSIEFVHPKDVQDGKIAVTDNDILTNLPYVPGCHLCFDHHPSEEIRTKDASGPNHILTAWGGFRGEGSLQLLWRPRRISEYQRTNDRGGGQGGLGQIRPRRHSQSAGMGVAFVLDGPADRTRPVPGFSRFQLPVDDAAHRLLQRAHHRGDSESPRRAGADRPLSGAPRSIHGSDPALHESAWKRGRSRLARRRGDLCRQPVHDLCALSGMRTLDPRHPRTEAAEHSPRSSENRFSTGAAWPR